MTDCITDTFLPYPTRQKFTLSACELWGKYYWYFYICSLRASSRLGLGVWVFVGGGDGGGGRERNESLQRCLTNLNAAPNTPHGFLLAELLKFDQSAPSWKRIFKSKQTCNKSFKTGILPRKTLHFLIDFVHHAPQKQENNSERFNFIVSALNVVNPKFVQPIDSQESNRGINTNKTVARLV